jgi:hypothetical protein
MQLRQLKPLRRQSVFAPAALALSFPGSVAGVVLDSTGAVAPQAKKVAADRGTGVQREAVTTGSGDYPSGNLF